jgi:hypothetical protein
MLQARESLTTICHFSWDFERLTVVLNSNMYFSEALTVVLQGELRWPDSNSMFRGLSCNRTTSKEWSLPRHWRGHDKQWTAGRIRNSIIGMKNIFNMTARSKIHHQYYRTGRICSEFIWQIFTGALFLHKYFSSLEQTRRILIFWKARGVKWWIENDAKIRGQRLTCSVAAVSCQWRPSWDTEMKTCSSQLYFHGLASRKSIHTISDRLWSVDRLWLYLILNKNWRVHSLTKLIVLMLFSISQCHIRDVINES